MVAASGSSTAIAYVETGGFVFGGVNRWVSPLTAGKFRVNTSPATQAGWIAATGDTNAISTDPGFLNATRDVDTYAASLGLTGTIDGYLGALAQRSRGQWNPALTAKAANTWIRAGFNMQVSPRPKQRVSDGAASRGRG